MTARHKKKHANSGQPAADPGPEAEGKAEVESLDYWKDKALRAQAEMVNMRRRMDQDVEERTRMRLESLFHELIMLHDHLELALDSLPAELADSKEAGAFIQGIRAIHASLEATLMRHGLEKIHPSQEHDFDSEHHEAVRIVESAEISAPRLELVRRGYRMGRRILRPAQVVLHRPLTPPSGGADRPQDEREPGDQDPEGES